MIGNRSILVLVLLVSTVGATYPQTPTQINPATDVKVKLVLADGKTTFRIGEPIRLVMEFTAGAPGYQVDILPEGKEPSFDTISISPDSGVSHWLDEMQRGVRYGRDVLSNQTISTTVIRVPLTLNDTLRFDRAGHYTVRVRTRRVTGPTPRSLEALAATPDPEPRIVLTTNEVSFDVTAMSEEGEQKEIKRISALLDTRRDFQTDESVTQELSFLTGDPSTREKVRRFLDPQNRRGNYGANIWSGLFIARNRELVLELLENAMRDVNQPVSSSLFGVVSQLRLLKEKSGVPFETKPAPGMLTVALDPQLAAIQNGYLNELALGLSKRKGTSLTTTATTILTMAKKDADDRSTLIREARRVLIQQFGSLHPYTQEHLLQMFWEDIQDPALIGPLKQLLSNNARESRGIHRMALERLLEMSPDEGRPYVIAQACDPTSLIDLEVMGRLSDKSLPQVDTCLLEQLKRLKSPVDNGARFFIQYKAALAARYATESIYQDVLDIYRQTALRLPGETAVALLAYLAKQNELATIPLIEETLAAIEPGQDFNFLPQLTKLYYSDAIGKVLKKRLELNDPHAVSTAAYLLGQHGAPGDELVLQGRLNRWQKEWRERVAEADANLQGMAERELIDALVRGTAWTLSAERKRELQQSCVTRLCKSSNR
jgi:hypothetical protein